MHIYLLDVEWAGFDPSYEQDLFYSCNDVNTAKFQHSCKVKVGIIRVFTRGCVSAYSHIYGVRTMYTGQEMHLAPGLYCAAVYHACSIYEYIFTCIILTTQIREA